MSDADIVLILGSGPTAPAAAAWPKEWFDRIVAINNAWRVRPDWDDLVCPEDFPIERRPETTGAAQRLIEADRFVPAQNAFGGIVYAGGTMAFTTAYWVLHALKPRVMAFFGCDMVYPKQGKTHFYGTGAPDPLRPDITLQDLKAKSARLGLIAAREGCACVNLSPDPSELVFPRATPDFLSGTSVPSFDAAAVEHLRAVEDHLGYVAPSGRYWEDAHRFDPEKLADIDARWRSLWQTIDPHRSMA